MQRVLELMLSETGMNLPPKIFMDMDGEFIDLVEGVSLTARFPNKERYMNPMGFNARRHHNCRYRQYSIAS